VVIESKEGDPRLWFVVDELDALETIEGLKDALARLRQFGGRCVLGFQTIAQVRGINDDADAQTCRFAFKVGLFALHDETFSLGVPSECRKQHSRRHFGHLFCESGAPTQSHHGGTKVCSISS
jgi:Type IV secretion-system coupling protein DNA-binding domain